jgi:hypothetical protein
MKRLTLLGTLLAVSVLLSGAGSFAQRGGGGVGGGGIGAAGDRGSTVRGAADRGGARGSSDSTNGSAKTPSELLNHNTKLASKLQSLLPAGTDLQQAAQGFKNLGQFVAAVHVSHNLGIPFDELKAKMIGPPSESLGKAIHSLKPEVNQKQETRTGERQAKDDMRESETSS